MIGPKNRIRLWCHQRAIEPLPKVKIVRRGKYRSISFCYAYLGAVPLHLGLSEAAKDRVVNDQLKFAELAKRYKTHRGMHTLGNHMSNTSRELRKEISDII